MKLTRNVGMLLLAVWLIVTGIVPLLNFSFSGLGTVMAILAIAAGVLIVVGRKAKPWRRVSPLRVSSALPPNCVFQSGRAKSGAPAQRERYSAKAHVRHNGVTATL